MKKLFIALLLIAAVIGISSCDLISGLFDPDYVGTWVITGTADDYSSKITLVLEKEAWEMKTEMKYMDDDWYLIFNEKGTMVVDGDSVSMTTTHEKELDDITDEIADDAEWVAVTGATADEGTWSVDGDELTIFFEDDGDGYKMVFTAVD